MQTEFDLTPIRNFCNELYARDTAKKIKATMKMKGEQGEHIGGIPFGYIKNPENSKEWIVDNDAAEIVRLIFKLCVKGFGPMQIQKYLQKERIMKPKAHNAYRENKPLPENPYKWSQQTIADILERVEYLGHTESFKTTSKNYRSKKRVDNPKEKRLLFENTHPAIIDENTFQIVQEVRKHKRRPTKTGKLSLFSGKVYCADCGATLKYCTTNHFKPEQDFFVCGHYRSNTGSCSGHYIRNVTLYAIVFQHIRNVLSYIQQFEGTFVKYEIEKENADRRKALAQAKKDIQNLTDRDTDLDVMFKHIYEDMVVGRLSTERFDKLSAEYEQEQKDIRQRISELQDFIENGEQKIYDLDLFLANVRKYTDPPELTAEILNDLIDKIIVHAPDKSSGHRKQKIEIYYKAVGVINIPNVDECIIPDGRKDRWNKQSA